MLIYCKSFIIFITLNNREEVVNLKNEVNKLNEKIRTSNSRKIVKNMHLNEQLITEEEEYAYETISNQIKENPESV